MTARADAVVIGAGAVGLAAAAALAERGREVVVVERHDGPGRETSSRNSGVIHAGLYYPTGSHKARACVEGRELLYARCAREHIAHRKVGKLIVAVEPSEIPLLEALRDRGLANGAGALRMLDAGEVRALEPHVRAHAALFSPQSGIVDAHALTASYAAEVRARGGAIAYRAEVTGLALARGGWRVEVRDASGRSAITARVVINAAGLGADRVASLAGLDVDALGWRLRFCKGDYFALAPRRGVATAHLVYPVPVHAGLGVHVTMDLGGAFHAGPDTEYVERPHYDVDPRKGPAFARALRRYLPGVEDGDLAPAYAGVRPKLYGPGEAPRDFVIEARPAGLVHLIGIESPGLTASESLARAVVRLADGEPIWP